MCLCVMFFVMVNLFQAKVSRLSQNSYTEDTVDALFNGFASEVRKVDPHTSSA